MADVDTDVASKRTKRRMFKKFSFRGVDLDQLLDMSTNELVKLFTARARRRFQRRLKRKPMALIKKLRKEVGECIGMWWRPNFETLPYPYMHCKSKKECTKLFLVTLPMSRQFVVPKNMKLLSIPLYQLHDNCETYGPIISGIPQLLSKFSFNIIKE